MRIPRLRIPKPPVPRLPSNRSILKKAFGAWTGWDSGKGKGKLDRESRTHNLNDASWDRSIDEPERGEI